MNKVFDFNIHLPIETLDVQSMLANELHMSVDDLTAAYAFHAPQLRERVSGANFMAFNQDLLSEANLVRAFVERARADFPGSSITTLVDFRRADLLEYIETAAACGIDGIKFHSYVQKITPADFDDVARAGIYAQEKELFICIDTSFGTARMFDYDNIKLAAALSGFVDRSPIVLLHSGGLNILKALLLAEDKSNVYLETSFTLPYYQGSSVERDLAFAYKKIGAHRVAYASDYPYVSQEESLQCARTFMETNGFSELEMDDIFVHTAARIINNE